MKPMLLSWLPFAPFLSYVWLSVTYLMVYRQRAQRVWLFHALIIILYGMAHGFTLVYGVVREPQVAWWHWFGYAVYVAFPLSYRWRSWPSASMSHAGGFLGATNQQPHTSTAIAHDPLATVSLQHTGSVWHFLIVALLLAAVGNAGLALQPCNGLDVALRRSGCVGIQRYASAIQSIAFSPDGTVLAVAGAELTVPLWRVSDQTLLRTIGPHADWVNSVAFSPDGILLATGSSDNIVRLWRVSDGTLIRQLAVDAPHDYIYSVRFSPDGQWIAAGVGAGANQNVVWIWRSADGSLLRTLPAAGWSIAFSPDSTMLAIAGDNGSIVLVQTANGAVVRTLIGPRFGVGSYVFSPDGTLLAGVSAEHAVWVWHVNDGTIMQTIDPSTAAYSVDFSPDGAYLATGGRDGNLDVWRTRDGHRTYHWEGTGRALIRDVAFSPAGHIVAGASTWQYVRFWQVPP